MEHIKPKKMMQVGVPIISLLLITVYGLALNYDKFNELRDVIHYSYKNDWDNRKMENNNRPIMYTFFERKKLKNGDLASQKELEFHQAMLAAWTTLWREAGWKPIVLTMADARKHRDFNKYSRKIIRLDKYLFEESYNYMCFMRWLAMAAQETGGWMCDYDTFPLGKLGNSNIDGYFLPNYGVFTSHERWVPSLLSGSAAEWNKMAVKIMEIAIGKIQYEKKKFYSDMLALMDLYSEDSSSYLMEHNVHSYPYKEVNKIACNTTKNLYAVHLSHASTDQAIQNGILTLPEDQNMEYYRSVFATELVGQWRKQCVPDDFKQVIA